VPREAQPAPLAAEQPCADADHQRDRDQQSDDADYRQHSGELSREPSDAGGSFLGALE
jgi:hypothetical protein